MLFPLLFRDEVIKEVFNAPRRRVDNEISRLSDSVHALHRGIAMKALQIAASGMAAC